MKKEEFTALGISEELAAKNQHDEEINELRLTTAIKLAVAGKVHNEDITTIK